MKLFEKAKRLLFAYRVFGRNLTSNDFGKLVRYSFKKFSLRKSVPLATVFAITYQCQCNCIHCSTKNYKNTALDELNTQEVKKILFSLNKLGIFKVTLFGGEPLLRKDILEIIEYARMIGLRVSIDTNGLLLTKRVVEKMKCLKISNINVSLDSADASTHDKLRRKPCFSNAVDGIKACVESGIPCLISTYASRRSLDTGDLSNLIRLARSLKVNGVKILLPILSGNWINKKEEKLSLLEEIEVHKLLDPSFVYIEDALSMMRNASKRCSALDKNFFYISPTGDVQLCPAIPISFGNLRHAPLEAILKKMWDHRLCKAPHQGCLMNNEDFRKKCPKIFESHELPIDISQF